MSKKDKKICEKSVNRKIERQGKGGRERERKREERGEEEELEELNPLIE